MADACRPANELKETNRVVFKTTEEAEKAGYKAGKQVWIAMDVAATEMYDSKTKKYTIDGKAIEIDGIEINEADSADASRCEVERHG